MKCKELRRLNAPLQPFIRSLKAFPNNADELLNLICSAGGGSLDMRSAVQLRPILIDMPNVLLTCKRVRRNRFGAVCAPAQSLTKAIVGCKRLLGAQICNRASHFPLFRSATTRDSPDDGAAISSCPDSSQIALPPAESNPSEAPTKLAIITTTSCAWAYC